MLHNNFKKISHSIVGGLLLLTIGHVATVQADSAGDRDTLFFQEPPSVNELAQHLFPGKSRGFVIGAKPEVAVPAQKSVGMPVLFHFGKTTLVAASKPFLDQVGELMQKSEHAQETLVIEGHTDAVGGERHNHKLSELRALAVKDYLVTHYNIDPMRLFPEGKGESRLFDEANPRAQVNRRVEFLRYR